MLQLTVTPLFFCLPQPASPPASAALVMGGSAPTVPSHWSSIRASVSLVVPGVTSSPPRESVQVSISVYFEKIISELGKKCREDCTG